MVGPVKFLAAFWGRGGLMAASNFSLGLNFLVYKVGFLMGSASVGIVSMLSVFLNTVSYYY